MITSNVLGNTQQYLKENPAIRSRCFTYSFSHRILFYHSFSNSNGQRKKDHVYGLYGISFFEFLLCNSLHKVGNMYCWTFIRGLLLLLFPINYI